MAFKGFDSGFYRDLAGVNQFYKNIRKAQRDIASVSQVYEDMAKVRSGMFLGSTIRELAEAQQNKWDHLARPVKTYEAWDRALSSHSLKSFVSDLGTSLSAPHRAATMAANMSAAGDIRKFTTGLQGAWSAHHDIKMSSVHDRFINDFRALLRPSPMAEAADALARLKPFANTKWDMFRVPPYDVSGFRSILKATTTYGPVIVTPEDDVPPPPPPSDYTPSLQGVLFPDTRTSSSDATDFEDVWLEVVAFANELARHHHSKVLIRVMGKHGPSFLVQVAAGLVVFWITYNITH